MDRFKSILFDRNVIFVCMSLAISTVNKAQKCLEDCNRYRVIKTKNLWHLGVLSSADT